MSETEQNPQPADGTVLDEAKSLLVQGKRFMAIEDYQSATDALEQAVQLFDAYYGVAKIQSADAYLEYGLALVALANLEAGSGADKIMKKAGIEDGGDEDEDEDEDEEGEGEGEDEGQDAAAGEADKDGNNENGKQENGKENGNLTNGSEPMETSHGTEANGVNNKESTTSGLDDQRPSASSSAEPTPGTSSGIEQAEKDEDDVENEEATTIEIAWEVLCLAKRLFMTDESLEGRLKLAETLQKLGEISIEWDNNDNAVSILEECLNIRKAILPPEDRLIALTYYHLGLAHSFKSETQNANENFQHAITVIEKRIEILGKELSKAKETQDTIMASSCEKEINELKELLPDMTMRMDDSKEDSFQSSEVIKRTREELQQEDDEVKKVCSDRSKPVDDISHLVKRKAT